jgi:8-oxo-dGTP pyrophosphatase MutT (NUDIX family)
VKLALADRLRQVIDSPPSEPPLTGDVSESADEPLVAAAVLAAVTDTADPGLLLTVRRENLRTHAGQIAFPGGRIEVGESAGEAAKREAFEELGLEPRVVDVIGSLDPYRTVTGFRVTPILAVVPGGLDLRPQEAEVADWFEAPLAILLDPAHQIMRTSVFAGRERHYWEIMWNGRRIWGATAAMIVNLSRRLRWKG